jgi:hypothetical protein
MKEPNFHFVISWDDRTILCSENVAQDFLNPSSHLTFRGVFNVIAVEIPRLARMKVGLIGNGRKLYQFNLTVWSQPLILTPSITEFTHEFITTEGAKFMNEAFRILRGWCDDDPSFADWRRLPIEMHEDWVTACRCWSGVPIGRPPLPRLEVDGNNVFSKSSFYCAVGEGYLGSRGYAGGNLDGFWDCLSNFDLEGHDRIVRFRSFPQIQGILDTILLEESEGKSYTEVFLEMLQEREFVVQFID